MYGVNVLLATFIFLLILLSSSRYFYALELKSFTKRVTKSLGLDISTLNFSFEQMVYFTSLPSNIPLIKNAQQKNIVMEYEYTSILIPEISGIKVNIVTDEDKVTLAYLPIKDFRLPSLDQMLAQGKINESNYLKISTSKLMDRGTLNEISEEVYKQIHSSRKGVALDD